MTGSGGLPVPKCGGGCRRRNPEVRNGTLVDQLWTRNCDMVEKFLNTTFIMTQAQGREGSLESFKYFSVQDYYYLVETIRHEAFLMAAVTHPSQKDVVSSLNDSIISINTQIAFTAEYRHNLTTELGIQPSILEEKSPNRAIQVYMAWLQSNIHFGWFAYQVSRIPCLYGWGEIANKVNEEMSDAARDSMFYKQWVEPNKNWVYGADLSAHLQDKVELHNNTETFEIYNRIFREAMALEMAFLESANNMRL
ncbi:hypothetical protein PT974_08077 [Cladobotryum mycophilum]|uniref:Thiaminase-2/PQQC domain-containing protein n=1 Tax=Cladobotryum mycophilum TaxID=491253 RepID=A0ABR0SCD8_9HYPO